MRTGSTWLVHMLREIAEAPDNLNANSVKEVLDLTKHGVGAGVIKTHEVVDLDWPSLPTGVPIVRVTRNYKDSLISRILYAIHIRPREGLPIGETELAELAETLGDATDGEFVNAFIDRSSLPAKWLAEIVVLERGEDQRCISLTYESLMHNPYDTMRHLVSRLWPGWTAGMERVGGAVRNSIRRGFRERETFLRERAIGVGGWETWLTCEQSEKLDSLYFDLRSLGEQERGLRGEAVLERYRQKSRELDSTTQAAPEGC